MVKKKIGLSIEKARELYKTGDDTFKAFLEENFDKKELCNKIIDRIQNWQDILDELNIDESFLPYKGSKLTNEEKSINAQAKLFKIVQVYNEGEKLKWNDTSQYKYTPYKYFSGCSWVVASGDLWYGTLGFSSGLYYKSSELSKNAYNKFKDVYEDFWNLS